MSKRSRPNHLSIRAVLAFGLLFTFLQNGRRRSSLGNALNTCATGVWLPKGVDEGVSKDVVSKFLCAAWTGRWIFSWTCTSQKWHKLFSAGTVEEIVVFLSSCYHQGRAFDLPQRCEKRCSHVVNPLHIKQVIGKNCTMLKWALVEKGTNFFHRVGQISIFL